MRGIDRFRALALPVSAAIALSLVGVTGLAASSGASSLREPLPPRTDTPPGQIKVVTVNAHQTKILGIKRFRAMYELARALRARPPAFDSGGSGAVAAPDVVMVQEMRPSNNEIFERLLRQRFSQNYAVVTPTDVKGVIFANLDTLTQQGETVVWQDACLNPATGVEPKFYRNYPITRFIETATGAPFAVAAMHMAKHYPDTQTDCYHRNIRELRTLTEAEPSPVIVGGDFNRRAVKQIYECDPNEQSEPLEWYTMLTRPSVGERVYVDAVRDFHRSRSIPLNGEWTHEWRKPSTGCDQAERLRRTRIDYLFASGALVGDAHADHPGWAGAEPGTRNWGTYKYSDHRFVWGRFVISGPPQPAPPNLTLDAGGLIHVSWASVEGATGWVLLRAKGDRPYKILARLPVETFAYDDAATRHGVTYRYAVAAIGANGAQGLESPANAAKADARGPRAVSVSPAPGSTGVATDVILEVTVNEAVDPYSVTADSIRLFRADNDTRIGGVLTQTSERTLEFDPSVRLRRGVTYHAVVSGLRDFLGNVGQRRDWRFTTVVPVKRGS